MALIGAKMLHLLSGTKLLLASCAATIVAAALFGRRPEKHDFWPMILSAMCCATFAIGTLFLVANVHLSNSLPQHQQGLAGSLSMVLAELSGALLLGAANAVVDAASADGSFKYSWAFWLEAICGGVGLAIFAIFIRVPKALDENGELPQ